MSNQKRKVKRHPPIPKSCRFCGSEVIKKSNAEFYGRLIKGNLYCCTNCDARVGIHDGGSVPKGTLANTEIRNARKHVHALFDRIWKEGWLSRKEAYKRMAKELDIPSQECHIGWFDVPECRKAWKAAAKIYREVCSR
ncbi:MAG: hypothetical protein F6J87_14680 [Spirulina sp. SIO3F2]|nr:hypothetical protein [Spirulina sp. SIO3F2]